MSQYFTFEPGLKGRNLVIAGMACYFPLAAQAAIVSGYGAYAGTSTASNCPSFCTSGGGGDFQYDEDGTEFSPSAEAEESSYAYGHAYSSLSGSSYLPTLKVEASADEGKRGSATAFGVQGYSYSGAAKTITLDLDLHGSAVSNPSGYSYNVLSASIAVLKGNFLDWYPSYGTLVYEIGFALENVGESDLFISNGVNVHDIDSITFDIEDGEDFYVIASMGATAQNGYVDAWSTLSLNFDDASGLTAASAVPVPAAVWLFGTGLLGLVGVARRQS